MVSNEELRTPGTQICFTKHVPDTHQHVSRYGDMHQALHNKSPKEFFMVEVVNDLSWTSAR